MKLTVLLVPLTLLVFLFQGMTEPSVRAQQNESFTLVYPPVLHATTTCAKGLITIERITPVADQPHYTASYLAFHQNDQRFLQVEGVHLIYLSQAPYEVSSATVVVPDEDLKATFQRLELASCVLEDVYLSELQLSHSEALEHSMR
ncbi:hypothetical protein [Neptuniibacter sp. CAU 1671]|uniref:hypothetical protein n=1 Tax=Neptuniibacter sp. CAU 1671 TaxID=3032593 RepID=UPI0023DBFE24|nr:hypothetical protein [Neptuniibacter sp. CAU 1671]MDF2181738.1 hypothetical protein [Neptuniibacter sp. CAU 1671]